MPTSWTNDPVTTSTPIKAVHVNELREAVDEARADAGLSEYDWTDDPIQPRQTPIKAIHFGELHLAIQELWNRKDLDLYHNGAPARPRRLYELFAQMT